MSKQDFGRMFLIVSLLLGGTFSAFFVYGLFLLSIMGN